MTVPLGAGGCCPNVETALCIVFTLPLKAASANLKWLKII
jgi:hypothetical protein